MILYRNGVVTASNQPTILIVWDLTLGPNEQDRHTLAVVRRWPFVQMRITQYMLLVGVIPGDILKISLSESRSVVVLFTLGPPDTKQIEKAMSCYYRVAIGAEYAQGLKDDKRKRIEAWA